MLTDWLDSLDRSITLAINGLHFKYGDQLWQLFSDIKFWIPLYLAIIAFLYLRLGWKRATVVLASLLLTFAACDQFSNLVKDLSERLRPCYDSEMISRGLHTLEKRGGFYGFFSAHAANAFGVAICSFIGFRNDKNHRYKKYGWFIFILALMVALSRIFAGKPYFVYVFVGSVTGLCAGFLFAQLAKLIINKSDLL